MLSLIAIFQAASAVNLIFSICNKRGQKYVVQPGLKLTTGVCCVTKVPFSIMFVVFPKYQTQCVVLMAIFLEVKAVKLILSICYKRSQRVAQILEIDHWRFVVSSLEVPFSIMVVFPEIPLLPVCCPACNYF
jgi:hypothetical protein